MCVQNLFSDRKKEEDRLVAELEAVVWKIMSLFYVEIIIQHL